MNKLKLFLTAFVTALVITIVVLFSIYKFVLLPKSAQSVAIVEGAENDHIGSSQVIEIVVGESLEKDIETDTEPNVEVVEKDKNINLSFVGDIYLSNYILEKYNASGVGAILSDDITQMFYDNDIVMANQEFAFSDRGEPMEEKQFTFRVNPKYAKIFSEIELDIVSLANNHALDYGIVALQDSFSALDENGIMYVGAGNNINEAKLAKHFELKDKKVAILGASRVIPTSDWNAYSSKPGMLTTYDSSVLVEQIKKESEVSDFIVVYAHWGEELEKYPTEYQKSLAKNYIDAGADLVIGSHPHILQGIEYYKGKPIVYSLGNFMFYYNIDRTAILNATISEDDEIMLQLVPCKASNAKTYLIDDTEQKSQFYEYMESISTNISFDENGFITNKE